MTNFPRNVLKQNFSKPGPPEVLIILPTLNEVENITPLLEGIKRELSDIHYTICIIDDGSIDGTLEKIEAFNSENNNRIHLIQRVKRIYGCQRGSALLAGMEWGLLNTDRDIFVEMDGDLSHRPEELHEGIKLIQEKKCDVAIASKYIQGGNIIKRSLGRNLISRVCSTAVGIVITRKIKDWSNGYRFYSREAAEILMQYKIKHGNPIYLTEVMAIWLKEDMRIIEFPTLYVGRNEGLSKVRINDLAKASLAIFEISSRYHFTGFKKKQMNRE